MIAQLTKFSFKYLFLMAGIFLLPFFFGDYYQAVIDLARYGYQYIVSTWLGYETIVFIRDYYFIWFSVVVFKYFIH